MDVLVLAFVILQVFTFAACFPNGAPVSTCLDMMPRHMGVEPQPTPAPYTIHTSATSFQTDKPITVVIKGPDYRGVLLEARSGSDSTPIGTWQTPPANTKFLQCAGNPKGAITHANTEIKGNSTMYTWTPPATANSVYFVATVAQQRTVYWLNVRSPNLPKAGGGTSLNVHDNAESLKMVPTMLLVVCWHIFNM